MVHSFSTAASLACLLSMPALPRAHLLHARVQRTAFSAVEPCGQRSFQFDAENAEAFSPKAFSDRFHEVLAGPTATMVDLGSSTCRVAGGGTERHAVTVVETKGPMICQSAIPDKFRLYETDGSDQLNETGSSDLFTVRIFDAPRTLPAGGTARHYAEAWPVAGVCTKGSPCPLIVSLHPVGSHSKPEKLVEWGYLNYYVRDESCRKSLRSAMIFPQLEDVTKENFAKNGPAILQDFIVPLVYHFLATNPNVDGNRVALIGASEGALGGIMASILHPDVFSVVVAGSATAPMQHFPQVPLPLRQSKASDKLRAVVIAWDGEHEGSMLQMSEALSQLVEAGTPKNAAVRGRLYVSSGHMETAEAVTNHYQMLHRVLWLGEFDLAGQLW